MGSLVYDQSMKTQASQKYITLNAIRRANTTLMVRNARGTSVTHVATNVTMPTMPTRAEIIAAGNNAVSRLRSKQKAVA